MMTKPWAGMDGRHRRWTEMLIKEIAVGSSTVRVYSTDRDRCYRYEIWKRDEMITEGYFNTLREETAS